MLSRARPFLAVDVVDEYVPVNEQVVPLLTCGTNWVALGLFVAWFKLAKYASKFPTLGPMVQASLSTLFDVQVGCALVFFVFFSYMRKTDLSS